MPWLVDSLYHGLGVQTTIAVQFTIQFSIRGVVNIPWMKVDPEVNIPWGSKYHMTPAGSLLIRVPVWDSADQVHSQVPNVNFALYLLQKCFLYAQLSINCIVYALTVIYLLLVARNL